MSGPDNPSDPFGRGDRTIIRPNPGGRRPAQPVPATAPAAAPPPYYPPPPLPGGGAQPEDWAVSRPPAPAPPPLRHPSQTPEVPVAANENPLLQAAGPLLMLLGRLRVSLVSARFSILMEQVADAVELFEKELRGGGASPEQTRGAKYALCCTADDVVQNIPGEDRHVWTQHSMLSRFFGERTGGVRFYEEMDKARQDPSGNYDLLELYYACLALGFQGIHRNTPSGASTLQQIQRQLYELLRRVRPRAAADLSPFWQGSDIPAPTKTFRVPFWAVSALAAAVFLAIFFTLRLMLSANSEAVAEEIRRLAPDTQIRLERPIPVVAPPPPPPPLESSQLSCIKIALAPEIAAQQISIAENASSVIIRIGSFASFAAGQAIVLDPFKPVAAKLGNVLEQEAGAVRIVGHTDSTPIANTRFASNYELSLERARAVAALVKAQMSAKDRVEVEGKAQDQPIATNETVEGRTRNRRVEVLLPRSTLQRVCPVVTK